MKEELLRNYAKLITKVGVNIKEGQEVRIVADVKSNYFVKYVVEEAYNLGAKRVFVDFTSEEVSKIVYDRTSTDVLCEVPSYVINKWEYDKEKLPCRIFLQSEDPDLLKGIDPEKLSKATQASRKAVHPIRREMENKYQWTIAALPSVAWAKKLFKDDSDDVAVEKLWDAIFKTARVYGDPIANWNEHNDNIHNKCKLLNDLDIESLHYESSNGTNFNISLIKDVLFHGGGSYTKQGNYFNPNMPTEECFTSPNKFSANGKVFASKPLSLNGTVIKDFGFEFENGKVKEVITKDEVAKKLLERLISSDENASYLGEVALVPFNSPVNETGILFYNTLFDENACCHLALGFGFNDCIKDFEKKTDEQLKAYGINVSVIHTDFMIGTSDLKITAKTRSGKDIVIFNNGTWAI